MQLIDEDALMRAVMAQDVVDKSVVKRLIIQAPTVDAIEVVRCRDCEYYVETNGGIGTCELTISGAKDDGFCAWGERKDDGDRA